MRLSDARASGGSPLIPEQRRNLILVRAGERSLHRTWSHGGAERTWDLQISSYAADDDLHAGDGDLPLSVDRGTKFDSLHRYLTANPDVFERYDYIATPDDDLLIPPDGIARMFATCREFDLDVAQPGQAWWSYYSHAITLAAPRFRLRFTNFVEAQWPFFRSGYLRDLMPLIENRHSGWGIDVVWARLMDEPWQRCAVVDEVTMAHTRPHLRGNIYAALADLGVDVKRELREVLADYGNPSRLQLVYGAVLADGRRIGGVKARLLYGGRLVADSRRTWKRPHTLYRGIETLLSIVTHSHYRPRSLVRVSPGG